MDSSLSFEIISECGAKNTTKRVRVHFKDKLAEDFKENNKDVEKFSSPIFNSSCLTNNNKIKNKLTYFTASESKHVKHTHIHLFSVY